MAELPAQAEVGGACLLYINVAVMGASAFRLPRWQVTELPAECTSMAWQDSWGKMPLLPCDLHEG